MKKTILSLLLMLATVAGVTAQQTKNEKSKTTTSSSKKKVKKEEVPKTVTESFITVYPSNPEAEWYAYPYYWDYADQDLDLDSTGSIEYLYPEYYEVVVIQEGKPHHSIFSRSGKHMMTHKKIKKDELPKAVADAFNTGPYKDWTIAADHEIVYKKDPDTVYYKMTVKKDKAKSILYYEERNGQLVQVLSIRKK